MTAAFDLAIPVGGVACCASSGVAGLPGGVLVFGFHGFSSERKFSIHKAPLETYMSKLCV
jgi:hypothetical protein